LPLAELLLAALTTVHPGGTEESRAEVVAAIVKVATAAPLWQTQSPNDESPEVAATALLLVAIAQHESSFEPRVGDCRVKGPGGAIGYFQLMGFFALDGHSEHDVCGSTSLGAELALRVLRTHQCRHCAPDRWLNGYASGRPDLSTKASRETRAIWVKLAAKAKLKVFPLATTSPHWIRS
jgi:hypothetical protein